MPAEVLGGMLSPASVTASAGFPAAAALQSAGGFAGLLYQIVKDQRLTGAQREANAFTEQMARQSMNFEADQAQKQMDFQERMANTQWQRGVQDMQAAGLNPALAYGQGGAAAPSGAMASGASGSSVDPGRGLSMSDILSALSYEQEIEMRNKQIESINQDIEGKKIDNQLKASDLEYRGELNALQVLHLQESINKLVEDGNMSRFQRQVVLPAQVALAKAQEKVASGEARKISADLVYTEWRNAFYKSHGFWPGESAGVYFWNMISMMIEFGDSPQYLPLQHPVKMPNGEIKYRKPSLIENYANRPKYPGFHYP